MRIDVTFQGKREFEESLKHLSKKGIRIAEIETTRKAAFKTQKVAKKLVKKRFVVRSKYMLNSIQVKKHPKATEIGSLQEGFKTQELGGVKRGAGGKNARVATSSAANQGTHAYPRTRTARGRNRAKKIDLSDRKASGSKKRQNWIKIRSAIATGERYVYLDMPNRKHKGIYKVVGGNKRTAFKKGGKRAKLRLMHDLTEKSYRIKKKSWLQPSTKFVVKKYLNKFYQESLDYQLKRLK